MTKKNHILKSHPEAFAEGSGERFFAFARNDKVRDCRATLAMTEQRGRSMVEMLGVLAVIGVLSVAGIAGYTTAMRSYRTNEIVNAASMLYVMAMAQNAGNGPTTNVGYTDVGATSNPSGVSTLQYNKDYKTITITFDDPNDCTMALNKLGDKATGICPTLTVTLGDRTANSTYDYNEWEKGSCPDGKVVFSSMDGNVCVASQAEAEAISASNVRKLIKENHLELLDNYIPSGTKKILFDE